MNAKYPKTPYWPWSPSIGRDDGVHPDPSRFVGEPVVVTEKLDGGNTLLHAGKVYARSVTAPSEGKWMAMVKKHHAWKVQEPGVRLYGEDIYGVHSIEYEPVAEHETFYAFEPSGRTPQRVRDTRSPRAGAHGHKLGCPIGPRDCRYEGLEQRRTLPTQDWFAIRGQRQECGASVVVT